jgi:hypothetical protein
MRSERLTEPSISARIGRMEIRGILKRRSDHMDEIKTMDQAVKAIKSRKEKNGKGEKG